MTQPIQAQIALFVSLLQALYDADYAKNYPNLTSPLIEAQEGGQKYCRILVTQRWVKDGAISTSDGQCSVYCFVNLSNGDLLKAAGFKGPAKGARGNIYNDNCDVGTRATIHGGGLYLRG